MPLTLYYHPLASYCHKVLIALYEHDIAFEARLIDLGADQDRAELGALWPFCKFPLLRDHAHQRTCRSHPSSLSTWTGSRPGVP